MISTKSALLLALPALMILAGCKETPEQANRAKLPHVEVRTEVLTESPVPRQVELSGTLQAVEQATISARVAGQVVKLPVKVGARVNRGDLLIRLSAEEINARLGQAEVQLEQDRRNLERESKLLEVNASTREQVKTLKEQVKISEAVYREAQTMLGYTAIRAPFAGVITKKLVEVGDLATHGVPLLKIEKSANLEVVIQVPEALSRDLTLGSRLPLTVPAAGQALEAEIREISPTVDPASRTTQIKLALPDATGLRSGQFARVALAGEEPSTLLVQRKALRQKGQMQQVFVAEQGTARMRLVRTGAEFDGRIEILSGLRAGDQIILDPPAGLRDGTPLVIADGNAR